MKFSLRVGVCGLLGALGALSPAVPARAAAQTPRAAALANRDGSHDFDFNFGVWKTHIKRFADPFSGSSLFTELTGTVTVHKVWGGRAQLEEIEADGTRGHWESLTLFLYNPETQQWSINFANSREGALSQPAIGQFRNGRGEFYDQETIDGKTTLVRIIWSDINPNAHRFEQSLSRDGGKTWVANFVATLTRQPRGAEAALVEPRASSAGQGDFDWQLGAWNVHMSRLQHPLTGSTTWTELTGTVTVHKVWNGRANLAEIVATGSSGQLEFLSLRLYNPQARQWSLNFASSNSGMLSVPMVGEFQNGRGEFYDQEPVNGRVTWVRFVFQDLASGSSRDEQAFSQDGGKTWETNWINVHTRAEAQQTEW